MRVAVLSPLPPAALTANLGDVADLEVVTAEPRTGEGLLAAVADADLVVGDYAMALVVDAGAVTAMPRARLFHQPTTGYDKVDAAALAAAGIPLTTAAGAGSVSVAEHCVMAALALVKSLAWCDREVHAGGWPQHEVVGRSLRDLAAMTMGLVGLGAAGRLAAERFRAFGCTVLYTARTRRDVVEEQRLGVAWSDLDGLLARADVVVLLVDLNPATRGLLSAERIAAMKPGAFLVNAARGEVVDEAALVAALREGRLGGAAVDVASDEPPPPDWPLRGLDRVLLTPHVAGATLETRLRFLQRTFDVVRAVARDELPDGVVNGVTRLRTR